MASILSQASYIISFGLHACRLVHKTDSAMLYSKKAQNVHARDGRRTFRERLFLTNNDWRDNRVHVSGTGYMGRERG